MGEPTAGTPPAASPPEDRLDSWKEIAAYLNRDVTTVQRWEKREGMPVYRHRHDRIGSVYASRAALDAWVRSRDLRAAQQNGHEVPPDATPSGASPATATGTNPRGWRAILAVAAVAGALVIGGGVWLEKTEYFWRSTIAGARFQSVTDFEGTAQAAAVSRDGQFIAFLSDRDGQTDVWVTQVGSGQFHNLTHGSVKELVNPSVRTLGFTADGAFVTFWTRKQGEGANASGGGDIGIWAVPTMGGEPKPYLEGAAEYEWSRDGSRLAYHTPGPGDPLFVASHLRETAGQPIFTAPAGLHCHFPSWASDGSHLYFVLGSLPDKLDIWRIRANGGEAERITSHSARVSYPVLLGRRTLAYLASDPDGSGPWLYSMDVERRIAHRLTSGPDRFTSLAANGDGKRLVATLASSKTTFWRLGIPGAPGSPDALSEPSRISLTTGAGSSPRLGPNYMLYVSATGTSESIWKLANGAGTELWSGVGARVVGSPAIARDGKSIAFSVQQNGKTLLYVMQADGTNARVVSDLLDLQGDPAWAPDGRSITSAAVEHGVPHLMRIPVDGRPAEAFVQEYSIDPVWAPDGKLLVYSGPDIGTMFSVKAVSAEALKRAVPALSLTRGARHLAFSPDGRALIVSRGGIRHKNLWQIDLDTGAERQLTNLSPDFDIRDFDISPDGREVVLERVQETSDVMLLDVPRR
jgi:Tol biopolymer transport system component